MKEREIHDEHHAERVTGNVGFGAGRPAREPKPAREPEPAPSVGSDLLTRQPKTYRDLPKTSTLLPAFQTVAETLRTELAAEQAVRERGAAAALAMSDAAKLRDKLSEAVTNNVLSSAEADRFFELKYAGIDRRTLRPRKS